VIGIKRFGHVSLLVEDTRRSLEFYQGLLGLAVNRDRPDFGFPGAWLDISDGQQIHLLESVEDSRGRKQSGHGGRDFHFALEVTDLEIVCRSLDSAGIAYSLSRSGRRALFCRDPDGNAIELVEVCE